MIHVTAHAVQRFQERVANLPLTAIRAALDTPAIRLAIRIGAPYVCLPTGQRVVIEGETIVTILPKDHKPGRMSGIQRQDRENVVYDAKAYCGREIEAPHGKR